MAISHKFWVLPDEVVRGENGVYGDVEAWVGHLEAGAVGVEYTQQQAVNVLTLRPCSFLADIPGCLNFQQTQ